jgi:hypothetical protein
VHVAVKFINKPELHEKGEIRKAGGKSWQLPVTKLSHFVGTVAEFMVFLINVRHLQPVYYIA